MHSQNLSQQPDDPPLHARVRIGVVVAMSIAGWGPAFTLGAWGVLFFEQILSVWAGATAALIAVLIWPPQRRYLIFTLAALLVPTLWLVLAITTRPESTHLLLVALDAFSFIAGLLGIPVTISVLAQIIWPDLGRNTTIPQRLIAAGIVVTISVLAYTLGVNNSLFLTCEDFTISGNSQPPGCSPS